jgi:hypothetical protein
MILMVDIAVAEIEAEAAVMIGMVEMETTVMEVAEIA